MTTVFLDRSSVVARSLLFVFLMSVVRTGFRLAVLTGANPDDDSREQIAAPRDSLGILLSFMLGFTLAMGQASSPPGSRKYRKTKELPDESIPTVARMRVSRNRSR